MLRRFTDHPATVNETYLQHMGQAFGFAFRMQLGALACFVHGVFPWLCLTRGSDTIRDPKLVAEAVKGCDAVIHLAAIHNPNLATAPLVYQTNVIGTWNVHQAAHRLGIKRVVSASSNAIAVDAAMAIPTVTH